ncbi:MAG: BtrH N-terminal domain-containing protein [Candidatus Heimdallarchaeaceae archaeon]
MTKKSSSKQISTYRDIFNDDQIILEKFKHMPGKNCQLSALGKVLAYYNINLSEEMLLGIASGLGFIYWDMKFMPCPFVGGLNGKNITLFENSLNNLGGTATLLKRTTSKRVSYKQVKETLLTGQPFISFVDMAFLPYFFREDAPYPNDEIGHFGGHTIVIYGLDEKTNTIFVSDRFAKPTKLTIDQFMDAHSSTFPPFPAKNRKVVISPPKEFPDLKSAIIKAIRDNAEVMLNPPITNLGLKGMLKFKKMVGKKWPNFTTEKLMLTLFNSFIYNATGGTGGAMFRRMYTRFLEEAYDIVQREELQKAADIYHHATQIWDEIAILYLPEEFPAMKETRLLMLETNSIQEEAKPSYQRELKKIDDRLKDIRKDSIKEASNYSRYIPALQEAIQRAYELEKEAWSVLKKI